MFCDLKIVWPTSINFVRNIYFCDRRFRRMKWSLCDRSHCRADVWVCIWPYAVLNTFYFCGILNKIHIYKCMVRCTIPTKKIIKIRYKINKMLIWVLTCGYGAKYHGLIRCLPNSIISIFFIRVTTSSWCVTMLPDCRGVSASCARLASSESSPPAAAATAVGVDGTDSTDTIFSSTGVIGGSTTDFNDFCSDFKDCCRGVAGDCIASTRNVNEVKLCYKWVRVMWTIHKFFRKHKKNKEIITITIINSDQHFYKILIEIWIINRKFCLSQVIIGLWLKFLIFLVFFKYILFVYDSFFSEWQLPLQCFHLLNHHHFLISDLTVVMLLNWRQAVPLNSI